MEAAFFSNDTFEPELSITIKPSPLNKDSKSLHNIFRGTGLEKTALWVFRCLLFISDTSTASLQVKSALVSLENPRFPLRDSRPNIAPPDGIFRRGGKADEKMNGSKFLSHYSAVFFSRQLDHLLQPDQAMQVRPERGKMLAFKQEKASA
jgi:hypothetical protein